MKTPRCDSAESARGAKILRQRHGTRAALLGAVALAASFAGACGYTTRSLVPDRYRTIAVPIFANDTRRHDLQYEVTQAVVEELQARTNLRVVPIDADPDLVMKGTLKEISEETLSHRERQRVREGAYFVTAEIDVLDRRADKPLVNDRKVVERESYVPILGEDVRTARGEATRALAERVVRTLESGW